MPVTSENAPVTRKAARAKGARVDIRTTEEIRSLIEQAATLQGLTVSEYAKSTLVMHAQGIIEQHQTRRLSDRDRDLFLDLLDNPPVPNDTLRAAANDFKQAVESGLVIL